ncbi:MAG: ERF family protein, partial [Winogradskyella sp.]
AGGNIYYDCLGNNQYRIWAEITLDCNGASNPTDIMYVEAIAVISDGENQVHTKAQAGIDVNRKGMDIAQSFGSSSSYARKYALNGLFLIDDTKDADATNDHSTKTVAEKGWLNKNTPEFKKAQTYLKGGGNISNIEAKYRISKEVKELLTK